MVLGEGERRKSYTCRAPDSVARRREEGCGVERRVGGSVVPLIWVQLVTLYNSLH